MTHSVTAEELFVAVRRMPSTERARFFSMLGANAFQDQDFSHEQVFGDLANDEFTASEAAEYLEVSITTFRRYVQGGKLNPAHIVWPQPILCNQGPEIIQTFATRHKRAGRLIQAGMTPSCTLLRALFCKPETIDILLGRYLDTKPAT